MLSNYLPQLLVALAFLVPLLLWFSRRIFTSNPTGTPPPPVYGPCYLPPFVRGLMAMLHLGADEDDFLLSTRKLYGPVVYIPWPLCQVFVLDGEIINSVYSSPSQTLSFLPIRVSMQHSSFGTSKEITQSPIMHKQIFPTHTRGLTTVRIEAPIRRFIDVVEARIVELGNKIDAAGGALEMELIHWVVDTMFDAATAALFGETFMIRTQGNDFRKDFATFDACFPLLAADMVPPFLHPFVPPIAKGMNGREHLFEFIATWVEDGMPGLDEGVILDMAQIGLTKGHSSREIASFLNADLWALQANTPNAAGALLLYIIQSTLLPVVREEINHIPTKIDSSMPDLDTKALASMEMVSSCVQETLRLNTSSYSIRVVEESFILRTSVIRDVNDAPPPGYLIQRGSRIVCATRAAHISDAIWGSNPSIWDGTRFLEREDDEARMKSKKAREMRGFGGGISICEGRYLASAELKAFVALTLSAFDITLLHSTTSDGVTPSSSPARSALVTEIKDVDGPLISPRRAPGRPGMGVFLLDHGSDVLVRVVRR